MRKKAAIATADESEDERFELYDIDENHVKERK